MLLQIYQPYASLFVWAEEAALPQRAAGRLSQGRAARLHRLGTSAPSATPGEERGALWQSRPSAPLPPLREGKMSVVLSRKGKSRFVITCGGSSSRDAC